MACLVFCHSEIILSLWSSIRFGIPNQDLLETLHGLIKTILIEFNLALTENELGNEILGRQESDKPVVFTTISVQNNDGRCPFDTKSLYQNLVLIEIDLDGNEIFLHGKADIGIGVSNSCQLLASKSKIVIKVHQD